LTRKLILASAGAGKTYHIVSEAFEQVDEGRRILVITYTRNNQKEILDQYANIGPKNTENFQVKGLFTFLLEDLIRPYQTCIFENRIETIEFNQKNPHKYTANNGRSYWIKGKQEKINHDYNPLHFLTKCTTKAHTTFLSKLATKIILVSKGKPVERLKKIYDHIYIDEVQDLVGWDYDVINRLSKSIDITCVGDFRQTIYKTSIATKEPRTNAQKISKFQAMKFEIEVMNVSRRSVQCICDFADLIHADEEFEKTKSLIEDEDIPEHIKEHVGMFIVRESDVDKYIERFNPTLLRRSVASGKQFAKASIEKVNFGEANVTVVQSSVNW
jgi:DNA helicase II / ATP-dependent DNA helicase PcrA